VALGFVKKPLQKRLLGEIIYLSVVGAWCEENFVISCGCFWNLGHSYCHRRVIYCKEQEERKRKLILRLFASDCML